MKQRWYWLLFVMLFAMITGGGCNGSSSGGGGRVSMEMTGLTTNDEGVPHVFALPDDAEQVIISKEDVRSAGKITMLKKREQMNTTGASSAIQFRSRACCCRRGQSPNCRSRMT